MQDYMPQWPLKVLILSSDPRNADRLRLAQEHRDLQIAIRGTRFASSLNVLNEPSCRYSDITAALDRFDPHILHFSGHGGEDTLYFEDVQGTAKAVRKQALAGVLSHQKELQLVILNACFSLNQGQAFADAVGLAIVSEGSILNQDAIDFSREFYTALGQGQRSYVEAFERAKSALEMTGNMQVHLLQRQTPGVQDVPASQDRDQTAVITNHNESSGSVLDPVAPTIADATVAVATAGGALSNAVKSSTTRRSLIALIVEFEDSMLWEMRRHPSTANGTDFSLVNFLCNDHMKSDPIPWATWNAMVTALENRMGRVASVNPSISKERLFGGFDANSLRQIHSVK